MLTKISYIRPIAIAILLAGIAYLSVVIYRGEAEKREFKEDLVELSKIKYGLFNVDQWKSILTTVMSHKIEEFDFDELPKEEIRKKVSAMLYKMTDNLESSFKAEKGALPRAVANITGIFDKIDDQVPEFTEIIMEFVEDPENRELARGFALKKLSEMTDSTFAEVDYRLYDHVIEKYGCLDKESTRANLEAGVELINDYYRPFKILLFVLALFAACLLMLGKKFTTHEYLFFTLICFCFLATGLSLPMIEIDARVSQMRFSLLGEAIHFQNQILYYKSKSILEVVQVMILAKRPDLIIVGGLVLLFSVLFPLAKLISSLFYIYWERFRRSAFVKFIIFKTGKWSMADVMVLAIFMAFIGFSGILREQLQQIEVVSRNLDIFTTNASKLQVGFYAFLSFAILSLLLAHKIQHAFPEKKKEVLVEEIREIKEDVGVVPKKRVAVKK